MLIVISVLVAVAVANAAAESSDIYFNGVWRSILDGSEESCWTTPSATCNRALTIAHGGDWVEARVPYDSLPAFQAGFQNGADAVKGDFHVNRDNIGMVMHSSPIEWYESPECRGQKVEEMSTAQCEACKMALSNYTFISVPEFLSWSDGKVNVMLCVKEDEQFPRAISTVVEANATHRAFLEIGVTALLSAFNLTDGSALVPGADQVYYIANLGSHEELTQLLAAPAKVLERAFLIEFGDYETSWSAEQLPIDIAACRAAGCKTAAMTRRHYLTASVQNHLDIWSAGFDVAYTYNLGHAVTARKEVNGNRGVSPP